MNLSVKLSGLVLTTAIFLFSCKKDVNNISLNEKPQLGVFFNDSLEIEAEVVLMDDSLQSSNDKDMSNTSMLVGNHRDTKFGTVTAESYVSIIRKSTANVKDAQVISGFISVYKSYSYGNQNLNTQTFPIYEINSFEKKKYFTKDKDVVSSKSEVLGVLTFDNVNPKSSRFTALLDDEFCNKLLFDTISNLSQRQVKGLHIRSGSDNIGVNRFEANNELTYINVKYLKGADTLDYLFFLGSDSSKFYTVATDFTQSPLNKIKENMTGGSEGTLNTSQLSNKAYVQAGTGLMMRLRIKGLKEFVNKIGPNALINGAELVLPFDTTGESKFAKPSLNLLYRKNGDYFKYSFVNFLHENKDRQRGNPIAVVAEDNMYRFVLTNYLRTIVKGSEPYSDLLVFPFENTNTFTLNRVVFNRNTDESKPFKLNIYYTK